MLKVLLSIKYQVVLIFTLCSKEYNTRGNMGISISRETLTAIVCVSALVNVLMIERTAAFKMEGKNHILTLTYPF